MSSKHMSGSLPRPKSWNDDNRVNNNQQGRGGGGQRSGRGSGRGGGGRGRGGNNNQTQDSPWDMPPAHGNNNNNNGSSNFHVQGPRNNSNNNNNTGSNLNGPANSDGDIVKAYSVCEFKRNRYRKYECPHNITTGQYVIVDGDRGQDCGLVVQVSRFMRDGSVQQHDMDGADLESFNDSAKVPRTGRVQRVADANEIEFLHSGIADKEQHALDACRQRCVELGLGIDIFDCEYQFDCKKISFFFDSERSVDFRELCKDLFRVFSARIWMENVNAKVRNILPGATAGKRGPKGPRANTKRQDQG